MAAKVRLYVVHPVACPRPNLLLLTPRRTIACHVDRSSDPNPTPTPQETGEAPRRFSSAKLSRWSRARALRSGRRLDRKKKPVVAEEQPSSQSLLASTLAAELPLDSSSSDEEDVGREEGLKAIYMVSDGTGWTLENAVSAALGQFEHCLVDRVCSVSTHLFSGFGLRRHAHLIADVFCSQAVLMPICEFPSGLPPLGNLQIEDEDRLLEIIKQAAKEGALLLFTLSDPSMAEPAKQACRLWGVPYVDVLGPTTEGIAAHLRVPPLGIPRSERKSPLTEEYFRRIEAVDFTIKQDDGAQPQNLNRAHIVLVGVSRTGKTPLSIYLAQKGYKVANVPIVMGVDLPKYLFEINQEKIFGLTINQVVLHTIRKARARTLGFPEEKGSNYSDMDHVKKELQFASRIYAQNPRWPVIEVTGKAIEETAAVVLRNYHDRQKKCSMPGISKRY